MVMKNHPFSFLMVSFVVLSACQASHKRQDEAFANQEITDSSQGDESEGVVGPDEAFFAEYYLEQVFRYSQENANPLVEVGAGLAMVQYSVPAFDFYANFTEQRLRLMTKSLYAQGDIDRDGDLTATEFASLKLDPELLGIPGEKVSHVYDQALFLRLAGDDELIQEDECLSFLRDIGPMIKKMVDRAPAQEQRRGLVQSWEKVLGRYDADQNGSLSLQEQRELRKDRAILISRLAGE